MQENANTRSVNSRRQALFFLPFVALVVLADEFAKRWALVHLPDESELAPGGLLSFAIHKNWGIAFDIPFKMPLIILISAVIGAALIYVAYRDWHAKPTVALSALMIVLGAIGNLYDRLAYGFTVDYIILFGRSAINVSDIVIVAGVVLLLHASRVTKRVDSAEEI